MVVFLNCDFLFFAFLSSIRFLFFIFFSLHFVHRTRILIGFHPLLFFFLLLSTYSRTSLSLSFSSSLIFYSLFFLLLLDSISSLALSVILDSIILLAFWCHYLQSSNTHRHAWRERRNRLCSTTLPSLLLLLTAECMQLGVILASIFFPCS